MSKSTKLRALFILASLTVVSLQAFTPGPLLAGVRPDPACEQQCHDDYIFCLDNICDPRGTCTCWTDYQSCVSYCPQICTEPRSVRQYTTRVRTLFQMTQTTVCLSSTQGSKVHNKFNLRERIDTYQETTNCNGTKTTQLLSSVQLAPAVCWAVVQPSQSCSNPQDAYGNYPRCTS